MTSARPYPRHKRSVPRHCDFFLSQRRDATTFNGKCTPYNDPGHFREER
jgi:hypothetical protein